MERNRRVAKAYARAPAISINGSEAGFDGYSIGINGFEPGSNDPEAMSVKKMIGKVCFFFISRLFSFLQVSSSLSCFKRQVHLLTNIYTKQQPFSLIDRVSS